MKLSFGWPKKTEYYVKNITKCLLIKQKIGISDERDYIWSISMSKSGIFVNKLSTVHLIVWQNDTNLSFFHIILDDFRLDLSYIIILYFSKNKYREKKYNE